MNLDTEMSIDTAETDGSEEEVLPQEADAVQPIYSMALTIDGDNAITYLDDHYVCVRADGYEYTGGAHGTPFRQYFVFDRETGARLSLSDVVENPVEELQAKLAEVQAENNALRGPAGEYQSLKEHIADIEISAHRRTEEFRARAMERLGQCIAQQRLWCSQRRSTYLTMNAALSQQLHAAQEEVDNADFTAFDDMIGELQRLEDELKKPDPQI